MKLIKINTDNYVVVDDSEIKGIGYRFDTERNSVGIIDDDNYYNEHKDKFKKITHSTYLGNYGGTKELSLQEVKELIGEVDVEKKACIKLKWSYELYKSRKNEGIKTPFNDFEIQTWCDGYNQALEDNNEKKYTEEDLRKAYKEGAKSQRFNAHLDGSEKTIDETIQSLQPKTEWEVEIVDGKLKLKS